MHRPLVADIFVGFGLAWKDHNKFAGPLVGSLMVDMQKLAAASGAAELPEVHRLLALANSWTAILRSAGSFLDLDWSGTHQLYLVSAAILALAGMKLDHRVT